MYVGLGGCHSPANNMGLWLINLPIAKICSTGSAVLKVHYL